MPNGNQSINHHAKTQKMVMEEYIHHKIIEYKKIFDQLMDDFCSVCPEVRAKCSNLWKVKEQALRVKYQQRYQALYLKAPTMTLNEYIHDKILIHEKIFKQNMDFGSPYPGAIVQCLKQWEAEKHRLRTKYQEEYESLYSLYLNVQCRSDLKQQAELAQHTMKNQKLQAEKGEPSMTAASQRAIKTLILSTTPLPTSKELSTDDCPDKAKGVVGTISANGEDDLQPGLPKDKAGNTK